jgi:glucokinase
MGDMAGIWAIGIDIGGTAVKCGLVLGDGTHREAGSHPTEAARGVDHVIGRIADHVRRLCDATRAAGSGPAGVGVGVPGTLSHRRGVVFAPPNLPGWKNVPLAERLAGATGLRVTVDNDANCAALGEHRRGAGRGTADMVLLTLGTGVGGGIIAGGKLWRGANENAGEFGHMIVRIGGRRCTCGQSGCLEAYASASNTAARAVEWIRSGEASSLAAILQAGDELDARAVAEAAAGGDRVAGAVWRETCECLAVACLNIQHGWGPGRIVLGGGMSAAGDRLLRPVREAMERIGSRMLGPPPEIRLAELGNDAGFIGAGLCALEEV